MWCLKLLVLPKRPMGPVYVVMVWLGSYCHQSIVRTIDKLKMIATSYCILHSIPHIQMRIISLCISERRSFYSPNCRMGSPYIEWPSADLEIWVPQQNIYFEIPYPLVKEEFATDITNGCRNSFKLYLLSNQLAFKQLDKQHTTKKPPKREAFARIAHIALRVLG